MYISSTALVTAYLPLWDVTITTPPPSTMECKGRTVSDRPLNSTAASLLGFLTSGPSSGWDLLRTARISIGRFWNITSSQLYRELTALDRDGLIRAGTSGARDRRPFRLTARGRKAFDRWLRQPAGDEQIRHPLLLTISFGRHLPAAELGRFIADHRAVHVERLAGYLATREAVPTDDVFLGATLDFGIRYEQAVLEWFDNLPAELTG